MGKPQIDIEVDDETGVWRVDGMPMILVPQHFLVNNHKAVEQALGVNVYADQLHDTGYKSAYYWCEAEAAHHKLDGEKVFHHYLTRLSQRGWGQFQVQALDAGKGIADVRVDHSVFVDQYGNDAGRKVCYMFLGWLVGSMEYVGKQLGGGEVLRAREVQCAGEGGHEHCLFQVRPA